jgi:hypothetical protein
MCGEIGFEEREKIERGLFRLTGVRGPPETSGLLWHMAPSTKGKVVE